MIHSWKQFHYLRTTYIYIYISVCLPTCMNPSNGKKHYIHVHVFLFPAPKMQKFLKNEILDNVFLFIHWKKQNLGTVSLLAGIPHRRINLLILNYYSHCSTTLNLLFNYAKQTFVKEIVLLKSSPSKNIRLLDTYLLELLTEQFWNKYIFWGTYVSTHFCRRSFSTIQWLIKE